MKRTILVIEDDNDLRKISIKMLRMAGYNVIDTTTRDEAVEIIENNPIIDTILLDIIMPGMGIDHFLDEIGSRKYEMRIIFSSGQTEDTVQPLLDESPNFSFLAKPYGLNDLQAKLQTI